MAGIIVLSDTLKVGGKLEKTPTLKGNDVADSSGNAAAGFAAMLSGSMNLNVDLKGQNSTVDQELEEEQNAENPVPSAQNPNGSGSMPGYGYFAFPFLSQPMLQSDLPAGKEANSGNDVGQGTGELATAKALFTNEQVVSENNLELAKLNLVSLDSDEVLAHSGMTAPKPQGDIPGITELDKYKTVIADLLVALSGEIKDLSSKEISLVDLETGGLGTEGLATEGLATARESLTNAQVISGNNLDLTKLNLASLDPDGFSAQSGMTVAKPQGENLGIMAAIPQGDSPGIAVLEPQGDSSGITEWPKHRQVISNLLEKLFGEITDNSTKGTTIGSVSVGTMDIRQEMVKIVQGWVTDEGAKDGQTSSAQKGIQQLLDGLNAGMSTSSPELNAKASTFLATLYSMLTQGGKGTITSQGVIETSQSEGDIIDPMAKGRLETLVKQPEGTGKDLEPATTIVKDTAFLTHAQQKSAELSLQRLNSSGSVRGIPNEEIYTGDDMQSVEISRARDVQNPNSSTGIGIASNLVALDVAGGKTIATPVYEQISAVFREQAMNKSQELKQLDIQLHPAELGKIQIGMRWEQGQVHLVVQASEATTGQLLQSQLSDLRQTLTSQGVNCGSLQMGQGGERQQQQPQGDEGQRSFHQSNSLPDEDESLISIGNPLALGQDGINRINVTA